MHTIKKYVKDMKAIPNTKSLYQSLTKKQIVIKGSKNNTDIYY